jgi:hypothetical protein
MRSPYMCLIVLAAAVILVVQPVAALPILQVPYFRAGPVWSLAPSQIANLVIFETNTSHLAASDSEALAVSFVPTGTGTAAAAGGFAIAPVIGQTSSRTLVCDSSYFFRDFTVP